jgi:hypothetical protein
MSLTDAYQHLRVPRVVVGWRRRIVVGRRVRLPSVVIVAAIEGWMLSLRATKYRDTARPKPTAEVPAGQAFF